MKKGFTLTELLVALTIVGGLIAILTPIVQNLMPNENVVRAKKAYHVVVVALQQMLNDQACYPDISQYDKDEFPDYFDDDNPIFVGLYDPHAYPNCKPWLETDSDYGSGGKTVITTDIDETSGKKFANVFMDKIGCFDNYTKDDTTGDITYHDFYSMTDSGQEGYICRTKDGMEWKFDYTAEDEDNPYIRIYVDVNGTEKPNRKQDDLDTAPTDSKTKINLWDFDYDNGEGHPKGKMYAIENSVAESNSYDTFRIDVDYKTAKMTVQNKWVTKVIGPDANIME